MEIEDIKTAFDEYAEGSETALTEVKGRIDDIQAVLTRMNRYEGGDSDNPVTPEQKAAYCDFLRGGNITSEAKQLFEGVENKTLFVGSDPDGGFAVPEQMLAGIESLAVDISPIRSISRVVTTNTRGVKLLINVGGTDSGWVGEQSSRPETDGPELKELEIPVHEVYAAPKATQNLLDDAGFSIDSWLQNEIAEEFAEKEGAAFVTGDGVKKPRGFLDYDTATTADASRAFGTLQYIATGVSGDWPSNTGGDDGARADKLIDLIHTLRPKYRQGAVFVMNSNTLAEIRKFKDADGNFIYRPGLTEGEPNRLLGYRVVEAEDMPDTDANAYAIAFGNFQRGYLVVERQGVRLLRDPFTNRPYVTFYTTKRMGGGVVNSEAIKLLKFSTS